MPRAAQCDGAVVAEYEVADVHGMTKRYLKCLVVSCDLGRFAPNRISRWDCRTHTAKLRRPATQPGASSAFALQNKHLAWKETAIHGCDGLERVGCGHRRTNLLAND